MFDALLILCNLVEHGF